MAKADDTFKGWLAPHRKTIQSYVENMLIIAGIDQTKIVNENLLSQLKIILDQNAIEKDLNKLCSLLEITPHRFKETIELIKRGHPPFEVASPDGLKFYRFSHAQEKVKVNGPEGAHLTIYYKTEEPWILGERFFNPQAHWDKNSEFILTDSEASDGGVRRVKVLVGLRTLNFED